MPVISAFLIDDDNEEKFWSHTLSVDQIIQVLDGPHLVVRNKKKLRASHLVIGTDDSGQCISIPIEPTHEDDVWRPVTAWLCREGRGGCTKQGQRQQMTEDTQTDQWDFENAELHDPVGNVKRVIVSVSLNRKDYDRISTLANDAGRKLSTYMRECALAEHADLPPSVVHSAGGPGAVASVVFTTAVSSGGTLAAGRVDAPDQITAW